LPIDVTNVGTQPLTVFSVQRLFGSSSFSVLASPQTPVTLGPGEHVAFTVRYSPVAPSAPEAASIRIASNDPGAPSVDLMATGSLETTPPVISAVTPSPAVLKPPNHKMRAVTLGVDVADDCDAAVAQSCRIVSIASSEPVEGTGDGDTAPDWEITGNLTARLRAERAGSGPGRTYTLTVECTDSAGNSATGQAT